MVDLVHFFTNPRHYLGDYPSDAVEYPGIPAVQSSFMPYQAHAGSPTKKHASNGLGPTIFNHFPTDGRLLPISPTVDPSSSARQEVNLQLPLRQSSGSSQSGSDEPLPSSSHAREVAFLFIYTQNQHAFVCLNSFLKLKKVD